MTPALCEPAVSAMTPFRLVAPEPAPFTCAPLYSLSSPQPVYVMHAPARETKASTSYVNNLYHVEIVQGTPFVHLKIRRLDGGKCDQWRHLQQIKNELVGPECEGVELFPSQGGEVSSSSEYHLWVHRDPSYRFPFGFVRRFVLDQPLIAPQLSTQPINADGAAPRVAA